ncbi:MAG: 4Fe-4S dicluster domain-containing protein [Anaerolineae bacterium]
MPKVFNWHLNREMEYPYEEVRPEKQFCAVFNINRCVGCQTCSMACKATWTFSKGQEHEWWNNVETKPYGGYPQFWDRKILEKLGPQSWEGDTYAGDTIFEAAPEGEVALGYYPEQREWVYPNIYEDTPAAETWQPAVELPVHDVWMFYLQRTCNHCTYPGCLAACPRKAIYKREEDGIVLIDQERCRGYRKCVEACPYKKSMYRTTTRTSEKCIGCYPLNEQGILSRCMAACVGKIRLQGWLHAPDKAQEDNPFDYLVHFAKVALPLYPQLGTEPNLYYIPPRWAPREYLRQLFGPGVDAALEKYTDPDPILFGVLRLFGMTDRVIDSFQVTKEAAIGFDEAGRELVRVLLDEPMYIRPAYDARFDVHRFNEP